MKQVFTKTLAELKKSYTTFSIILIFIAAISSFFTTIRIVEGDTLLTGLYMLYVIASSIVLMIFLTPFLIHFEEYLRSTKFGNYSLATLFVKKADHALINVLTLLASLSIMCIVIAVMTNLVFSAAIVIWLITMFVMTACAL